MKKCNMHYSEALERAEFIAASFLHANMVNYFANMARDMREAQMDGPVYVTDDSGIKINVSTLITIQFESRDAVTNAVDELTMAQAAGRPKTVMDELYDDLHLAMRLFSTTMRAHWRWFPDFDWDGYVDTWRKFYLYDPESKDGSSLKTIYMRGVLKKIFRVDIPMAKDWEGQ